MPTRERRHIQIHADGDIDDAPVLLENCYHTVGGDGKRGAPLPSKLSLSRLSFRWQVSLSVRAEARWSPTHTTSGQSVYCDPFFGCAPTTVANNAEPGQANIGIILRFGK